MTLSTGSRPSVWEREVLDTETADGVVGVVRDYLTLWKPDELAQLPGQCAPSRFEAPEDVVAYAILVREAQASTPRGERAPLDTAGDFVVLAARRIVELQPHEIVQLQPHEIGELHPREIKAIAA